MLLSPQGKKALESLETLGFHLRHRTLEPGSGLAPHTHGPCLCLVFAGGMIERDVQGPRLRQPGDLIYRPPDEAHSDRVGRLATRVLILEMDEWKMSTLRDNGFPADDIVYRNSPLATTQAFRIVDELRTPDSATPLILEGIALELLGEVSRGHGTVHGRHPLVERVQQALHDEPAKRHTVGTLAHLVGLSATELSREFRCQQGTSIGDYLRRLRVERAKVLLAETEDALVDIAIEVGFYDQSHLTRTFRRLTGMTPASFRRAHRS